MAWPRSRSAPRRVGPGKGLVMTADQRRLRRYPPIRTRQIPRGVVMTPDLWRLRRFASRPSVSRPVWRLVAEVIADRHRSILLALLESPSIGAVFGVSLERARASRVAGSRGPGCPGPRVRHDAPELPMRSVPKKPRIRDVTRKDRLRIAPAAKKCLGRRSSRTIGRPMSRPNRCWPRSSRSNHQVLRLYCWVLSAWTLGSSAPTGYDHAGG